MDIIDELRQERAEKKRKDEEELQKLRDYDPFANKGTFNGLGVEQGLGSINQDVDYKPHLGDTDIPKRMEVVDVFELAGLAQVHEGKFGMNIADDEGVLYETAMDVVRSWGISTKGVPKERMDALAHYFLLSMRWRFLERYQAMLSCVASVREYADFKGVPYSRISNKVFAKGAKGLQIIVIGGTRFVMIQEDEFYEWHKFLAEKGAKELADHEEKEKAVYLAKVAGDLSLTAYDSVKEFLGLYEGGVKPEGGRGRPGKPGNFFDALAGKIGMNVFYEYYFRWAKDVEKIEPVKKSLFNKRVYAAGYRKWNRGGKRGIYFYRTDERPIGSPEGQLKIPHRGSYSRSKIEKPWDKFEDMGGEIK